MTSFGANLGATTGREAHHVQQEFMNAFNNHDEGQLHQQQSPNQHQQQNSPNQHQQPLNPKVNTHQQMKNSMGQTNRSDYSQNNGFMKYHDIDNNAGGGGAGLSNNDRQKSLSLEYGKTIRLLRNGDEFYRGRKFVINSRKYRYFDVFMDDISDVLNSNFGAIRKIHTPINGHRVKTLDQLEDGKTYVAAGNGRFIRLNYADISEGKRLPPNRLPAITRQDRQDFNSYQVPQYDKSQNAVIYVYRNGDVLNPPSKILLYKSTMMSYNAVLDEITNKVQLLNGAVQRLYTMDGEIVQSPAQLINGHAYVAANKERFKRCEYYPPQSFALSPRMLTRKSNSQPTSTTTSSNKNAVTFSGTKYTGWHKESSAPINPLPPVVGPKTRNPNVNRLNVDKDESGIYKARHTSYDTVKTVEDSHDMFVDMPVDFKKANRVIQEEIDNRPKKMSIPPNEIMKPNSKQPPQQIHIENLDEKRRFLGRKHVAVQTEQPKPSFEISSGVNILENSNKITNMNKKLENIFPDYSSNKVHTESSHQINLVFTYSDVNNLDEVKKVEKKVLAAIKKEENPLESINVNKKNEHSISQVLEHVEEVIKSDLNSKSMTNFKLHDENGIQQESPLNKEIKKSRSEDLLENEAKIDSNIPSPLDYEIIKSEESANKHDKSLILMTEPNEMNVENTLRSYNQNLAADDETNHIEDLPATISNSSLDLEESLDHFNSIILEESITTNEIEELDQNGLNEEQINESFIKDTIAVEKTPDELFPKKETIMPEKPKEEKLSTNAHQQNSVDLAEEEAAAIKIQSVYRGYKTRADLKTKANDAIN